jgi:hypothetical protein
MQSSTNTSNPFEGTPAHAVASFLYGATSDENGRCMAAAMLTLSLWQSTPGPPTLSNMPSAILVNAGDATSDPLDGFAEEFVFRIREHEQSLLDDSNILNRYAPGDPEKAMRLAMWGAEQLIAKRGHAAHEDERMWKCQRQFHNYRERNFGGGPGYRYTRAWTEQYGWLSNHDARLVLRLDQAEDRKAMRQDLLSDSEKLCEPRGIGWEMMSVSKKLAFSGSLHSGEWDDALVTQLLCKGWPVVFLPHSVITPLRTENKPGLHMARMKAMTDQWLRPITPMAILPKDPWFQYHHGYLRSRLSFMPADYCFAIERIVRELGDVCMRLAHNICCDAKNGHLTTIIGQDLFRMTLRAIVIGVAALGYHCWGFTARLRAKAMAVMHHLRTHGPSSRRDLLRRFQTMDSQDRDELLEMLENEDLIECDGRLVSAVPLSDYIERLQNRPDFPQTGCLSSLVLGREVLMAGPLPGMEEEPKKRPRRRKPAHAGGGAPEGVAEEGSGSGSEPESGMPGCHEPAT